MKIIKIEENCVLILDGKIKAWLDIWVENQDIICDWNQNYNITNTVMKWQNNLQNYECASSLAIQVLEKNGVIYQDKNARWHKL